MQRLPSKSILPRHGLGTLLLAVMNGHQRKENGRVAVRAPAAETSAMSGSASSRLTLLIYVPMAALEPGFPLQVILLIC